MNLTITKAAQGLHVSRKQLSDIVNETASISAEMAVRLKNGFGVNVEFWLDLQNKFDVSKIQESGRVNDIERFTQTRGNSVLKNCLTKKTD